MEPEFTITIRPDGRITVRGRLGDQFMEYVIDREERGDAFAVEDVKQHIRRELQRMVPNVWRRETPLMYGPSLYGASGAWHTTPDGWFVRSAYADCGSWDGSVVGGQKVPGVSAEELAAWDEYDQQED